MLSGYKVLFRLRLAENCHFPSKSGKGVPSGAQMDRSKQYKSTKGKFFASLQIHWTQSLSPPTDRPTIEHLLHIPLVPVPLHSQTYACTDAKYRVWLIFYVNGKVLYITVSHLIFSSHNKRFGEISISVHVDARDTFNGCLVFHYQGCKICDLAFWWECR